MLYKGFSRDFDARRLAWRLLATAASLRSNIYRAIILIKQGHNDSRKLPE
jgi:hypothetical protein